MDNPIISLYDVIVQRLRETANKSYWLAHFENLIEASIQHPPVVSGVHWFRQQDSTCKAFLCCDGAVIAVVMWVTSADVTLAYTTELNGHVHYESFHYLTNAQKFAEDIVTAYWAG